MSACTSATCTEGSLQKENSVRFSERSRFGVETGLTFADVVGDVVAVEGLVQELPAVNVQGQGAGEAEAVAGGVHVFGVVPLEQVEDARGLEKHALRYVVKQSLLPSQF